jgi:protein-S-isoprenylcysteine O-methyltransferase Ste14
MDLYSQKGKSIPQKIVIHLIEALLLGFSYWILFRDGGSRIEIARRSVIFAFNIITFLRLAYMMFFLLKRKIHWAESVSVPLAFALYYVGFSLFVLPEERALDILDFFAIGLFLSGSILNSGGEYLRDRWKRNPANKGKIYTGGFFRYSRHINYFGDILWVSAYAIITRNIWAAAIPVVIFCFFAFYNAPLLDKYLKEKYGDAYDQYSRKTKMLIPFIY